VLADPAERESQTYAARTLMCVCVCDKEEVLLARPVEWVLPQGAAIRHVRHAPGTRLLRLGVRQ